MLNGRVRPSCVFDALMRERRRKPEVPDQSPPAPLHRDAHRNANARVAPVVEVVAVVDIGDIDLVVVVPVVAPVSWPRVNNAQPITAVLEARISANHHEGQALDAESMIRSEITAKA